jgi:hypothetical protein
LKKVEVKIIVNLVREVGWCKKRSERKEQMKMEIDAGAGWCRQLHIKFKASYWLTLELLEGPLPLPLPPEG